MIDISDNYFLAERRLQTAVESIVQTRVSLLKYSLALQTKTDDKEFARIKTDILKEYQKNEIHLSSLLISLKKQEINGNMAGPTSELFTLVTEYLLNLEKVLSSQQSENLTQFMKDMDDSTATYIKIKSSLENLTEMLRQKALHVRNSDSLITQYFPPILLASFFVALIIGGSFIYVSRREVRKSVLDQTSQILTEAYQYQQDCLQTLEMYEENRKIDDRVLEERKSLHTREMYNLRESLKKIENLEKA